MIPINYAQLVQFALPEIIVVVAALLVLVIDLLFLRKRRTRVQIGRAHV